MDESRPANELAALRNLLERLQDGRLAIRRGKIDLNQYEISILKREIAHLERILSRSKVESNRNA
jgi:hypothetical protein